jgi:adenosylhomocysteine nucleosidase
MADRPGSESVVNHSGIVNMGGRNTVRNSAVGEGARVTNIAYRERAERHGDGPADENGVDIGVVTILAEEARALKDALGLTRSAGRIEGRYFSMGEVDGGSGEPVRIAMTQTQSQGPRSTMSACEALRRHFAPRVLALVGIGGGLDDERAGIGNVVVATRVVYYDHRKITPDGVRPRGEAREAPAEVVHGVNAYFADHGDPAEFSGQCDGYRHRTFEAVPGLIGTGDAVIADRASGFRAFLHGYNDKTLAVDMEAGGLSQYWQENSAGSAPNPGWVVVRGISDHADEHKSDGYHRLAAENAAFVFRGLVPYLR